jgi:hypothetical protein
MPPKFRAKPIHRPAETVNEYEAVSHEWLPHFHP